MKVVYVAGAYSAPDCWKREGNVRAAEAFALQLVREGFCTVCPHPILEGRKTNTRRLVDMSEIEPAVLSWINVSQWLDDEIEYGPHAEFRAHPHNVALQHFVRRVRSPWKPGDLIWVREGWRTGAALDAYNATQIAAMSAEAGYRKPWAPVLYGHPHECDTAINADTLGDFGGRWGRYRAARFMPRWASRLTLRVTSVRVERLQEISEADAVAEGVAPEPWWDTYDEPAREAFARLWDAINGKDGRRWSDNQWVWVVGFEVMR